MDAQDWQNLGSVFRAGSERARGWCFNSDRQPDADIAEAQAGQCEEIARELDGNPAIVHDHGHFHDGANGDTGHRYRHAHAHSHGDGDGDGDGENGHEGASGRRHEPRGPLFPESWGRS